MKFHHVVLVVGVAVDNAGSGKEQGALVARLGLGFIRRVTVFPPDLDIDAF